MGGMSMRLGRLSPQKRQQLKEIIHLDFNAARVRRAEVILWLADGETPTEIARRLGISRRTIYYWVDHFSSPGRRSLNDRLVDRLPPGRPSQKQKLARKILLRVLKHKPEKYGYPDFHWKTKRLQEHVQKEMGVEVSLDTIRLVLRRLPIPWGFKRPRYTLFRRSPTWRQSKGGSNAGFLAEKEQ